MFRLTHKHLVFFGALQMSDKPCTSPPWYEFRWICTACKQVHLYSVEKCLDCQCPVVKKKNPNYREKKR